MFGSDQYLLKYQNTVTFPWKSYIFWDFGKQNNFCVSILDYHKGTKESLFVFKKKKKKESHISFKIIMFCYSLKYGNKFSVTKFISKKSAKLMLLGHWLPL